MTATFCFWVLMLASTLGRLKISGLPIGVGYLIILLVSLGLFIYNSRAYCLEISRHRQALAVSVTLLAFSLLSTLLSPDFLMALRYYVRLVLYILLFYDFLLLLSIQMKKNRQHQTHLNQRYTLDSKALFLSAWVGFLLVLSLLGMIELFFPGAWIFTLKYPSFHPRIGSIVQSPNTFGVLMVLGLFNAFYILKTAAQKSASKLIWPVTIIFLSSIILSGSRAAFLLLLLATAAYSRTGKMRLLKQAKILVPAVLVMLVIMVLSRYPELVTGDATAFHQAASHFSTSATSRLYIWQVAVQEFFESPLVGQGFGIFPEVISLQIFERSGLHSHNFFVEFAVSLGVAGIFLSAILTRKMIVSLPRLPKIVVYSLVIVFMSQMVDFFAYDLTFSASAMYVFALANALLEG